ncbi:MAG: response regulator transcription factor [Deltaproteobacteria bacterium]|nr:response regulator transcription factor [Deltaproteobacteria bacterium]
MLKKRVLICDDHGILREGLKMLLSKQSDIEILGEASTGEEIMHLAKKCSPDIIIMDISLPDINGIALTKMIVQLDPRIAVLILTMYNDKEYLVSALRAGAKGYLIKEGTVEEMISAIDVVYKHQIYIDKRFGEDTIKNVLQKLKDKTLDESDDILTPREKDILSLIADGKSNKEIASVLNISAKTVDVHRSNIMRKLDVHDAISLVKKAAQKGWIKIK